MKKFISLWLIALMLVTLQACDLFGSDPIDIIDDIDDSVTIEVFSNTESAVLSVEPEENITVGQNVTIEASNVEGFIFLHWLDGEEVFSESMQYSFNAMSDLRLEAVYESVSEMAKITLSADPSGATISVSPGDEVFIGDIVTFKANAMSGYIFKHWFDVDNDLVLSTDAIFDHTVMNDLTILAVYEVVTIYHNLTFKANIEAVISGPSESNLLAGSPVTLEAPDHEGYVFLHWNNTSDDLVVSYDTTYQFTLTDDVELEAVYHEITYYEILIDSNRDSLDLGLHNPMVLVGTHLTVEAPNVSGLSFSHWEKADGAHLSNDLAYSFIVSEDVALIAIYDVLTTASDAAALALSNFDGDLEFLTLLLDDIFEESFTTTLTFEVTEQIYYDDPEHLFTNQIELTQKYLINGNQTIFFNHLDINTIEDAVNVTFIMVENPLYIELYLDLGFLLALLEDEEEISKEIFGFDDDLTYIYLPITKDKLEEGIEGIIEFFLSTLEDELDESIIEIIEDIFNDFEGLIDYLDLTFLLNHELMESQAMIHEDIYLETHLIFEEALINVLYDGFIDEMYALLSMVDDIELPDKQDFLDSDDYEMIKDILSLLDGYHFTLRTLPYDNKEFVLRIDIYEAMMMIFEPEDIQGIHGMSFTIAFEKGADVEIPQNVINAWDLGNDILSLMIVEEILWFGGRYIDHIDLEVGKTYSIETLRRHSIYLHNELIDKEKSTVSVIEDGEGQKDLVFDFYYSFNDTKMFKAPLRYQMLKTLDYINPQTKEDMDALNALFTDTTIGFIFDFTNYMIALFTEELDDELIDLPLEDLVFEDHDLVLRYPDSYIIQTRYDMYNHTRSITYVANQNYDVAINHFYQQFDNEQWHIHFYESSWNPYYRLSITNIDGTTIDIEIYESHEYIDAMEIEISIRQPQPFPSKDLNDSLDLTWLPRAESTLLYDASIRDEWWVYSYITQADHDIVYTHYMDILNHESWEIMYDYLDDEMFYIHAYYGYYNVYISSSSRTNLPFIDTIFINLEIYDESPEPLPSQDLSHQEDHAIIPRYEHAILLDYYQNWSGYHNYTYGVLNTSTISLKDYFTNEIFTSEQGFDTPEIFEENDYIFIEVYHGFTMYFVKIFESSRYIDTIEYEFEIRHIESDASYSNHHFVLPMDESLLISVYEWDLRSEQYAYITKASVEDIVAYFNDSNTLEALGFTIEYIDHGQSYAYIHAVHDEWELGIEINESYSYDFPNLASYYFIITDLTPTPIPQSDLINIEDSYLVPRFDEALHLSNDESHWRFERVDHYVVSEEAIGNLIDYFMEELFTLSNGFSDPILHQNGTQYTIYTHHGLDTVTIDIFESQYFIGAYEYVQSIRYISQYDHTHSITIFEPLMPNSAIITIDEWNGDAFVEIISIQAFEDVYDYFINDALNDFVITNDYKTEDYASIHGENNQWTIYIDIMQYENFEVFTMYYVALYSNN